MKNIKSGFRFFFTKSKKFNFFIFIKTKIEIKYCINIISPTDLMLTKNAVKKDNKITLLSIKFFLFKYLSKTLNEKYVHISQKDKRGISFVFINACPIR